MYPDIVNKTPYGWLRDTMRILTFVAMKDFLGVFVLLLVVFGSLALFGYLAFVLDYLGWAFLQMAVSTMIVLFCIRYLRSHRTGE